MEFTEEEEAIKANLESDEPLPAEVLDTILPAWWNKEPFKWVDQIGSQLFNDFPKNISYIMQKLIHNIYCKQ